ncbi:hypothetical protein [Anabaena sp. 4-3]|nr:hypothetical protein [Anabaena sp. 4-3]
MTQHIYIYPETDMLNIPNSEDVLVLLNGKWGLGIEQNRFACA